MLSSAADALPRGPPTPAPLLPRCYQTIRNHADPLRTASVPSVEIFELYIVVDLGGHGRGTTLNQRVRGSSPRRPTKGIGRFRSSGGARFACGAKVVP